MVRAHRGQLLIGTNEDESAEFIVQIPILLLSTIYISVSGVNPFPPSWKVDAIYLFWF
jgi:hypothetical protein